MDRFLIWRIVNIVSITNFFTLIILERELSPIVVKFSRFFSIVLFIVSLVLIVVLYIKLIRRIERGFENISSRLSVVFKYILPNFMIAGVLLFLVLGLIYDKEILKVFLLFSLVMLFPVIIYFKAVIIAIQDDKVRIYGDNNFIQISGSRMQSIDKVLLGFIYKIRFLDDNGRITTKYFFPSGILLSFFGEPDSIRLLKSLTHVDIE